MGEPERIAGWCASSHDVDCLEPSQRSFSVPYTGPGRTVSQQLREVRGVEAVMQVGHMAQGLICARQHSNRLRVASRGLVN